MNAHQQLDAWVEQHFDEQVAFLRELVRNPLIIATVAGLDCNLAWLRLPELALTPHGRIGAAAQARRPGADDDAAGRGVDVDHVTRLRAAAGHAGQATTHARVVHPLQESLFTTMWARS